LIQVVIDNDIIAASTLMHGEKCCRNNLAKSCPIYFPAFQFVQRTSRILAFDLPPAA